MELGPRAGKAAAEELSDAAAPMKLATSIAKRIGVMARRSVHRCRSLYCEPDTNVQAMPWVRVFRQLSCCCPVQWICGT